MYTSRPCLSHLLHFKPTNAHNHTRFRIILQKPQNPICFGPYWPITWEYNNCIKQLLNIQGGADKSLARPGRKKATATKLGIYPTDSPQSSIHFLASCSNFCKPLKKKFRRLSVQPGLCGSNDLHVGLKMATFRLFFHSKEQVVVQWSQIWRIVWVIKTLEAQVGQLLLGCECSVSQGIFMQEQDPLGDIPKVFFLQNDLQLQQQR